jgi:ribosomal protein S27E
MSVHIWVCWEWSCPECGHENRDYDEPEQILQCANCDKEFEEGEWEWD